MKLYGRVARHMDVRLCSTGALGFYLMYRFHYTHQWDNTPHFINNASWFNVKLLIESTSQHAISRYEQVISNRLYHSAMKNVC
jgi:hypothetical protein